MKISPLKWVVFLILFVTSYVIKADTVYDFIDWNTLTITKKIDKFLLRGEAQVRLKDDAGKLGLFYVRPSIGYQINDNWQTQLGFTYQASYTPGNIVIEYNVFQDVRYSNKFKDVQYVFRTRLEERTYAYNNLNATFRLRNAVRLEYPITDKIYVAGYDEVFVNLNGNQVYESGFDQNWFWVGPGYKFTPNLRIEVGYFSQYANCPGKPNQFNQGISTQVSIDF